MNTNVREWLEIERKKGWMVERLSEVVDNPDVDFKVGDRVVFTNDYGVSFPNQKNNSHRQRRRYVEVWALHIS